MNLRRFVSPITITSAVAAGLALAGVCQIDRTAVAQQTPSGAAAKQTTSHSGEFVGATDNGFKMTIDGTSQHAHTLAEDANVTLNGKPAELQDLKKGDKITVTTPKGETGTAIAVAATRRGGATSQPKDDADNGGNAQENPRGAESNQPGAQNNPPGRTTPRGDRSQASLGVRIQRTPDDVAGVQVVALRRMSAAEQAGIRPGDYILSFNGKKVTSPQNLIDQVSRMKQGDKAQVVIWRNGERRSVTADFNQRAGDEFAGRPGFGEGGQGSADRAQQEAWLGVVLNNEQQGGQKGVEVTRIFPSGPAARAGLQSGDTVLSVNGKQVSTSQQLGQTIDQMQPGDSAKLVVMRNDQKQTITTRLGSRREFLGDRYEQRAYRSEEEQPPFGDVPPYSMMLEQHRRFAEQHQRIEERLTQLTEEVRQLRKQLGGGTQQQGGAAAKGGSSTKPSDEGAAGGANTSPASKR